MMLLLTKLLSCRYLDWSFPSVIGLDIQKTRLDQLCKVSVRHVSKYGDMQFVMVFEQHCVRRWLCRVVESDGDCCVCRLRCGGRWRRNQRQLVSVWYVTTSVVSSNRSLHAVPSSDLSRCQMKFWDSDWRKSAQQRTCSVVMRSKCSSDFSKFTWCQHLKWFVKCFFSQQLNYAHIAIIATLPYDIIF